MSDIRPLINELERSGIRLRIHDGRLQFHPPDAPEEIRQRICEHNFELSLFVRAHQAEAEISDLRRRVDELENRVGPTKEEVQRARSIAAGLRFDVLHRDGFRCTYCGVKGTEAGLRVDHIIPVSKGGKSTMSNLTTACESCNAGKSDKDLGAAPTRTPEPRRPPPARPHQPPSEPLSVSETTERTAEILSMLASKRAEAR